MVHLSSSSLALYFFCLTSASVILLPAFAPPNETALSIPVRQVDYQYKPISPLPFDPPGFSIDYVWTRSRALNPLGVYVTAIKLMYGLALQTWNRPVELLGSGLCIVSQQPEYNVIIYTSDEPSNTELTTGLVVKMLYEAITAMAMRQPGFLQVAAIIRNKDKRLGKMYIEDNDLSMSNDKVAPNASPVADFPYSNQSSIGGVTYPNNSSQLLRTNAFVDPQDSRFRITWHWEGKNIPAQDVFSAALNGLAATAQYDQDAPSEYVTALSTSGNAILHIGRSTSVIVYSGTISRAFYQLINQLFLKQKRFEEMWFDLSYAGVNIADGYLHKVVRVGEGEGVASE